MSIETPTVDGDRSMPDLGARLDEPTVFEPPANWAHSTSWVRAQQERDLGGPLNPAERVVLLADGASEHRVLFAIWDGELRAECDCDAWKFRGEWCAHVAACWWQWTRDKIDVVDLDTNRTHTHPPAWFARRGGDAIDLEAER